MRKVKAKEDGVRLMGFGHRVYKNYDPRAKYFRGLVIDVLEAHVREELWPDGWRAKVRAQKEGALRKMVSGSHLPCAPFILHEHF